MIFQSQEEPRVSVQPVSQIWLLFLLHVSLTFSSIENKHKLAERCCFPIHTTSATVHFDSVPFGETLWNYVQIRRQLKSYSRPHESDSHHDHFGVPFLEFPSV